MSIKVSKVDTYEYSKCLVGFSKVTCSVKVWWEEMCCFQTVREAFTLPCQ